jgi:hypothetical protein
LAAYEKAEPIEDATIGVAGSYIQVPRRQPDVVTLQWADKILIDEKSALHHRVVARALKELHERPILYNEAWQQAIRIGDTVIVGLPGEIFCQVGLDIKEASPFAHTMAAELTNGNMGYVASTIAHENRKKVLPDYDLAEMSYETRLSLYTNCVPETHAQMVETARMLMKQLKR